MFNRFQSLAGFLARCDYEGIGCMSIIVEVSIPGGFSGSLRLLAANNRPAIYERFQSLAGFLARCDLRIALSRSAKHGIVSIPGGFSGSLRREH